ncbi:hypothetical protein NDU88_004341 [Pleurodeles waltl]|uniref:Uncharacterized protein n=1 Tax=Pleurodeles waltl TaxID=8319 RepID=A0AAV7SII1_PLEWA|nr:hypothetical protein NDU88_004341 [Pleurodeles waltl]
MRHNCKYGPKHTADIAEVIIAHELNILFLTDTRLKASSPLMIDIIVLPNFLIKHLYVDDRPEAVPYRLAQPHEYMLARWHECKRLTFAHAMARAQAAIIHAYRDERV